LRVGAMMMEEAFKHTFKAMSKRLDEQQAARPNS
jgi:hypothetical protein